jgi:hypothetical protein
MNGPRIFQVGTIVYGAGIPGLHQDITDMAEAQSALVRIKAEGGPTSISYKNYNLPSRCVLDLSPAPCGPFKIVISASRQRLLLVARNLSMGCVPEGVNINLLSRLEAGSLDAGHEF